MPHREMHKRRKNAAAAVVNGKIYCCGGWNGKNFLNSTECYDSSSDNWTLISNMPGPNSECSAAEIKKNLIVMGGWNGKKCLSNVWVLDTMDEDTEWTDNLHMSRARCSFCTAKIDNKIFVCGGFSEGNAIKDVEIFDGNAWKNGPELTIEQSLATAISISASFVKHLHETPATQTKSTSENSPRSAKVLTPIEINLEKETVLMLGGCDGERKLKSLLILQNDGKDWKELAITLPYGIQEHGAQYLNNSLYIFGGCGEEGPLNYTYKLSEDLKWKKMADMNHKRFKIANSSVLINGRIWVLGGKDRMKALKSVETYNPVTNKWACMSEMKQCRSSAAATVANKKIFCFGGLDENAKSLNSAECYDPSSAAWTLICDMPQPCYGLSAVEMNGSLLIMGGLIEGKTLNNVYILGTTNKNAEWAPKPQMNLSRSNFSIVKIDGRICVCGGQFEDGPTNDVEIFEEEILRNGPKLPTARTSATAIVIPANVAKYVN